MKIAYIAENSPMDINTWSGTTYHVYKVLSQKHTVEWIGKDITKGAYWHHRFLQKKTCFNVQIYTPEICQILSDIINAGNYDIVITSVFVMSADLDIHIPIVYLTDIIFKLGNGNYFHLNEDDEVVRYTIEKEKQALRKADSIIFSSELVKETAVRCYHIPEEKIRVLDFGANIPDPENVNPLGTDSDICNLTFVGREWKRKGGNKMLEAFRILKKQGFACKLTIIGSEPEKPVDDPDITIIPFLDKKKEEDLKRYDEILRESHFMVLPTLYDAYGILFCEASAYGVPSIAANVGGVSQPVREGVNGYLLPSDATAADYAKKIRSVFEDKEGYRELRLSSRKEYETRLNWDVWGQNVIPMMEDLVRKNKAEKVENDNKGFYIPVYAFNLKSRPDRLKNLKAQFRGKSEFDVTYMEAVKHENGAVGLWLSICNAVRMAQERKEDLIVLCEDDHEFTKYYSKEYLLSNISRAYRHGSELLNGGIGGFGTAVPVSANLSWIDWFWCTQFVVIFEPLYSKILEYDFKDGDTADGVLSKITQNSLTLYPPISTQKDYGYSDIIQRKEQSAFQNNIFKIANQRLGMIHTVHQRFSMGMKKSG